jgi:hypothetical protein
MRIVRYAVLLTLLMLDGLFIKSEVVDLWISLSENGLLLCS